ncbi:hypothetical protein [Leucobacter chinensis]|uniref:hypothetical protein n=1 Tax=Leucobacter chinensis TaxID=2851010 RepID=UPI001C2378BD|nr:hypothetical protein [Leucobacter chinensis]
MNDLFIRVLLLSIVKGDDSLVPQLRTNLSVRRPFTWWIPLIVFVLLATINLSTGLSEVSHSVYRSEAQLVSELMGSPIRLLFPVAVAVIAGPELVGELRERYIASTRTRADIRAYLSGTVARTSITLFLVFAALALVNVIVGLYVAPALWPESTSYIAFNLESAQEAAAEVEAIAPLTRALAFGPVAFMVVCGVWSGLQAVLFGVLMFVSAVLIHNSVLALATPLVVYLLQSFVLQVLGLPAFSFLLSSIYPEGLASFDLSSAVFSVAVLGVMSV